MAKSIEKLRLESSGIPRVVGERKAAIVQSEAGEYGVQFWTDKMSQAGSSVNSDKSVSNFIEWL